MENRIAEICMKVLEINKSAEEYVSIFADGGWDNYNYRDRHFFIFKDGDGQNELMQISYEEFEEIKKLDLIEGNSYSGYKARSVHDFKIGAVSMYLNSNQTSA